MDDALPPPQGAPLDRSSRNALWAGLIIEELVRLGVDRFCISPGSRSTPLTVAAARHPRAQPVVHVDERGSAFFALGHARATGRPAAWITTSGTAVANGLPAVVEASLDGVPLLCLTADRPPELRATSANQTIDQVKIFGDYPNAFFDLPCPTESVDPAFVLTTVDHAVARTRRPPGPVHLNCMFREPLAPLPEAFDAEAYLGDLEPWISGTTPFTRYTAPLPAPDGATVQDLARHARNARHGLVVAGALRTRADADAARALAETLGWALFPDIRSRLRLGPPGPTDVARYDLLLTAEAFRNRIRPDMVVYLGRPAVSKRLLTFLDHVRPDPFVVVDDRPARIDPTHQATHRLETGVAAFVASMTGALNGTPAPGSSSVSSLRRLDRNLDRALDDRLQAERHLTEPAVARLVCRHLPAEHALVLGNSMPVRDVDAFADTDGPAVPVFANRGASGIDGTIATAAGIAAGRGAPATLLLGDLSLLHDLNALAYLRDVPVVVVVVNNDGGGIFSFLPIAEFDDVFEPCFGTPHGRTFEQAARLFDLPYARPETTAAFIETYRAAVASGASSLIEVRTDRRQNLTLHRDLQLLANRSDR